METTILFPGDSENLQDKDKVGIRPFSVFNSSTRRLRPLYAAVAVGDGGVIGAEGDLLWHIGADLKHFKQITMGHPVIMGRTTFESLPGGALPGRRNIVITRNAGFSAPDVERASSPEEAVAMCEVAEIPFVIGGQSVYEALLPLTTRVYLTRIYAGSDKADVFFPELKEEEWVETERSERFSTAKGLEYQFFVYERK